MGINFYFGNKFETLVSSFFDLLKKEKDNDDPFYPPLIVVPNVNLVKYLKMYIADKSGIYVNFNFKFLENGINYAINQIDAKNPDKIKRVFLGDKANHIELELMILSTIVENENFSLIKRYLGEDKNSKDYMKKIRSLSGKLAGFFREYEYQRKDMIEKWLKGDLLFNNLEIEKVQSVIYKNIFGQGGIIDKLNSLNKEVCFTNMPSYSKNVFKNLKKDEKSAKKNIYFFGFSQISQFHYDIILKLSDFYNVSFFKLNFLKEFSETNEKNKWLKIDELEIKNERVVPSDDENALVKIWASPSRESVKLLGDLIKSNNFYDIKSFWLENEKESLDNPSVLNILQNNISNQTIFDISTEKNKQDSSVQIVNCPDIFTEVQTVYNDIIHNMQSDPSLKLTDIAVLIPDMNKYYIPIKAIFSKEESPITYNLSDINASNESSFGKALIKMLEIATSSFSRKDIFELFTNEIFMLSNGISFSDVSKYLNLAEKLNVYRGYDKNKSALYSWQNALSRLKLGYIMEYEETSDEITKEILSDDGQNPPAFNFFKNPYKNVIPYSDI
nr:exodeoxyribonuclease V subunit gamma [Spirochaetota bacterium]